jgi:23S rRNA (adenine1618-N6)-methyltransferase
MQDEKNRQKSSLHPRNKHQGRYDFEELTASYPKLSAFVSVNDYGNESIDFFNPEAVKALNKALLQHFYGVQHWDIPPGYLCPAIPGRADYIHYAADLITESTSFGKTIKCLDIGTGANVIYPIIGATEYNWSFVGSDIDPGALQSAQLTLDTNTALKECIELRLQTDPKHIFRGIIQPGERFDLTICNPPFHASAEDAHAGTARKLNNLTGKKGVRPILNFGGRSNELWCEGGEEQFVRSMIRESEQFAGSCHWFTTLISRESNLRKVYKTLNEAGAAGVRTIRMAQGNKVSRFVAWTFKRRA